MQWTKELKGGIRRFCLQLHAFLFGFKLGVLLLLSLQGEHASTLVFPEKPLAFGPEFWTVIAENWYIPGIVTLRTGIFQLGIEVNFAILKEGLIAVLTLNGLKLCSNFCPWWSIICSVFKRKRQTYRSAYLHSLG